MDYYLFLKEQLKNPRKKALFKLFMFFLFFLFIFIYVGFNKQTSTTLPKTKDYLTRFEETLDYKMSFKIDNKEKIEFSVVNDNINLEENLNYFKKPFVLSYIKKGELITKSDLISLNSTSYTYRVSDHYFDFENSFEITVNVKNNMIERVLFNLPSNSDFTSIEIEYTW